MPEGKKIALGITGGIAAYKAAELVSRLKKCGCEVRVVMSENATKFIAPLTLETLSANRAYVDQFSREFEMDHIGLARWSDVFVVAPATYNFIGKMASGIADDLVTTTAAAVTCPILLAPAMNTRMWKNPACRENMEKLRARGVLTVGPESGILACGDEDVGRMSEPQAIIAAIENIFAKSADFAGKRILVTAGPTVEMIDPVRYITNRSSGKMGYAVAAAARARGAEVTLVTGPVSIDPPAGVEVIRIQSAAELYERVIALGDQNDVIIQAAAPADFAPESTAGKKIKKSGDGGLTLHLVQTKDIAAELGKRKKPGQILVAFAAETNDLIENARKKMAKKNADLVVANDVMQPGAGFNVDTNRITILTKSQTEEFPLLTKREAADAILDAVLHLF